MNAEARGWGRGWPGCKNGDPPLQTVTCGANRIRLSVRPEIAVLVARLVADLERGRGRGFDPVFSGGYNCRPIKDTNTPSNHSWGLAVDLDWDENPQRLASVHAAQGHPYPGGLTLISTMPQNAAAIGGRYGFDWGGHYKKKPDPMHFEFMGTPNDAALLTERTEVDMTKDELLDALESDRGQRILQAAVVHVLRVAVGPDDGSVPAGVYFGNLRNDVKDIKSKVNQLG